MTIETKNAVITGVRLGFEDHGLLTAWLDLDYGDSGHQGFGGWCLGGPGGNYCGEFIQRCLATVGVNDWSDLSGQPVRVKSEHTRVHAIGHIVKDKWFDPGKVFEKMEKEGVR